MNTTEAFKGLFLPCVPSVEGTAEGTFFGSGRQSKASLLARLQLPLRVLG